MSLTTTTTTLSPTTATVTTTISANRPPPSQSLSSSFSSTTKTLPRSLRKRLPTPFSNNTSSNSASSSSTRAGRGLASSLSTPNLSSLFASHARRAPGSQGVPPLPSLPHQPSVPLPLPLLTRKASLAALTSSSLATIPDATESYAFDTLNEFTSANQINNNSINTNTNAPATMAPLTPGRFASSMASYSGAPTSDELVVVGDPVDVPGGMHGTVRFVGSVAGRKGVFAGVELHPDFAARGKNSGDVDGVSYFNTNIPGAGIFLPLNKAVRRDASPSSFPMTPSASNSNGTGLKLGNQNSTNFTPPTPSLPKFSQSVSGGPIPRAPSPQHGNRRPPRTSLPRPDSPVRRLQMTPAPGSNGPRPSLSATTPGPKSSTTTAAPGRFGSPTQTSKFSQSMRAPATGGMGDPSKRGTGLGMFRGGANDRKASIGPRSASALGGSSNYGDDDNATPTNNGRIGRTTGSNAGSANGSIGSASSFSGQQRGMGRPPSRTASHMKNGSIATATTLANSSNGNNDEEVERLKSELQDRERQLKDQASTLADMESSLTELQGLIESSDGPLGPNGGLPNGGLSNGGPPPPGADGIDGDDKDVAQMRALLREKNDKIAMLTAEFDAHRADFRSTIDTLEMASTETERVYEKKIEEMMQENQELESRLADVDAVAQQLKQLEELVQELEEGLEDARRGEAEARGEVEFLRGEVERTRTELRREREKAAMMVANGASNPGSGNGVGPGTLVRGNSTSSNPSKDLEQKDDEIRGLKAIIHSLSQNAGVNDMPNGSPSNNGNGGNNTNGSGGHRRGESINERLARETLEREVADLRALLDNKSSREMEMEREIEQLRVTNNGNGASNVGAHRTSAMTVGSRSSLRDSRGTVVLARDFRDSLNGGGLTANGSNNTLSAHNHSRSNSNPRAGNRSPDQARKLPHHSRGPTLDTMPESDAYSSVTESSTLWCEICETNGHDILTCTNMFGSAAGGNSGAPPTTEAPAPLDTRTGKDVVRAAFAPEPMAPIVPLKVNVNIASAPPPPEVKILPNPMESGPVAGKESGVVDAGKWCALCERDGHDSVDCPFEDAF